LNPLIQFSGAVLIDIVTEIATICIVKLNVNSSREVENNTIKLDFDSGDNQLDDLEIRTFCKKGTRIGLQAI